MIRKGNVRNRSYGGSMNPVTASIPRGAHVEHADLRAISFRHVPIETKLVDVEITGDIDGVTINGVDVGPLVEADSTAGCLSARRCIRPPSRDTQEAWQILERLWAEEPKRARALPPSCCAERVRDEWSFIETLRRLGFRAPPGPGGWCSATPRRASFDLP